MPVYHFICTDCGIRFEKRIRYEEIHQARSCPSGHSNVRRVYSVPTVVFKGTGFYSTDHRKSTPTPGE